MITTETALKYCSDIKSALELLIKISDELIIKCSLERRYGEPFILISLSFKDKASYYESHLSIFEKIFEKEKFRIARLLVQNLAQALWIKF